MSIKMKKFKITEKDFEKLTAPSEPTVAEEEESEKKKKLKEDYHGYSRALFKKNTPIL